MEDEQTLKGEATNHASHVLVVEDNDVTRKNIVKVLADEGYRVTTATDGDEGIKRVLTDPPDVILTNLRMPKLDGLDLLLRVKQVAPQLPVLMMTALTAPNTKRQAFALGVRDFIEKPFDFPDLLARL